jgi:hypothetical protein
MDKPGPLGETAGMTPSLADLARARGLALLAQAVDSDEMRARIHPFAEPDANLVADPAAAPLAHMVRRGLEPRLVAALLPAFAERPLERGLLAWDVLTGSVFSDDVEEQKLLGELRAAARAVAPALPSPGQRGANLTARSGPELVETFAVPAFRDAAPAAVLEAVKDHALGALARVPTLEGAAGFVQKPEVLESVRAFARLLRFAHAPTLASVYLDYLWRGLNYVPAFTDLCEIMLDADAMERMPLTALDEKQTDQHPELRPYLEYVLFRTGILKKTYVDTYALLKETKKKRSSFWRKTPPEPLLQIVEVELGALLREAPVKLEAVEQICQAQPEWRYAAEMRIVAAAMTSGSDSLRPLEMEQRYLNDFGNRFSAWFFPLRVTPAGAAWRREAGHVIAREAFHLPHAKDAWRALVPMVTHGDVKPSLAELDERVRRQSADL